MSATRRAKALVFTMAAAAAVNIAWLSLATAQERPDVEEAWSSSAPPGYKLLSRSDTSGSTSLEFVRQGENGQNWTRIITLTVFAAPPEVRPADFLRSFGTNYIKSCKEAEHTNIINGTTGKFPSAFLAIRCGGENPGGLDQSVYIKAIRGSRRMYVAQVGFRGRVDRDGIAFATDYLEHFVISPPR